MKATEVLNMTEEQIVHEIQTMRLFDKYLIMVLGKEKYVELSMGMAKVLASAELMSLGATDEEIEEATHFAEMMMKDNENKERS